MTKPDGLGYKAGPSHFISSVTLSKLLNLSVSVSSSSKKKKKKKKEKEKIMGCLWGLNEFMFGFYFQST